MSSLNRNYLYSASLVIRDKCLAKYSSFLSFKRFSLLLISCLLQLVFSHRLSLSKLIVLPNSLILKDICSFCSPMLSTMLVKVSSIDAPLSTQVTWRHTWRHKWWCQPIGSRQLGADRDSSLTSVPRHLLIISFWIHWWVTWPCVFVLSRSHFQIRHGHQIS